ncbi:XrtA-associated tyrosine autokinase [Pseudomaricurvus sp.]|uniref:XrtA-associated tyrosine autokinase n=1 Tax=Pseudomaricurvus sp. TaxID=2004510 RepID=UPI003F6B02D2
MSIIEKAINKLESERGRDALLSPSAPENDKHVEEPIQAGIGEPEGHDFIGKQATTGDEKATSLSQPDEKTVDVTESATTSYKADIPIGSNAPIHVLPVQEMAEKGMIVPQRPRSQIADEYRTIKRPLLQNIDKKGASIVENANLIMVTSALPGEGKTFSAINLAMSIATEQDKTVLLVDADVTKASAAAALGIPDDSPGLIDLLEDEDKTFSDVLVHTSIPKLRILPAGRLHEHATELLASENMKKLMHELSARYPDRVIIFDSPPLLITTEASVLASLVGQVVFVVAAEQSSQSAVEEAVEHIGGDKVVGLVLNKVKKNPLSRHGYGYGYGYGYGEGVRRSRHYQPPNEEG